MKKGQQSFDAKKLQKYFDNIKAVMLIPTQVKHDDLKQAMLGILFDADTHNKFRNDQVNKIIVDLLDDKYPILMIKVDEKKKVAKLSITDEKSGLSFNLPDQPLAQALINFVQNSKPFEKVALISGYFEGEQLVFDPETKSNVLIVLDGFRFE